MWHVRQYVAQVRERGVVTLPKAIRDRYGLATDTPLTLVDWVGCRRPRNSTP